MDEIAARYLASEPGQHAIAQARSLSWNKKDHISTVAHIRSRWPEHAAAITECAAALEKNGHKFATTDGLLLTGESAQQATHYLAARHRAHSLTGRIVHDATCSIGGELRELTLANIPVIGSDIDPTRVRFAHFNAPEALVLTADALKPITGPDTVTLIDPARRSGGTRTHDPAALIPPLPDVIEAYRGRDIIIKCAPGIDYTQLTDCEVEMVSIDGAMKEAAVHYGQIAHTARRATVISTRNPRGDFWQQHPGYHCETITSAEPHDLRVAAPGMFIVDPDAAIIRAGLVRHWASRHKMWQLDERIAHLSCDELPSSVAGFPFISAHPLDKKVLRKRLRELGCGRLEILVRGSDTDPDSLRKTLKLSGDQPFTLVITRIEKTVTALVCGPRTTGG